MAFTPLFLNYCFDKSRLKSLITWSLLAAGERRTIEVVERLKELGFRFATEAGTSLGVDDLKVPPEKLSLVSQAKQQVQASRQEYERGNLTALERLQQLVDTWHRTSETLKQTVVNHFQSTDKLSPVYMMAFSGARGNISQVRQLAGMRGLMADPQGQIIGFPIRSNFREGLTLIEYMISCYGARKGLVDTALRTADAGYLTRRLVDVSQHMVIRTTTCATPRGIYLRDLRASGKVILPLRERLMGRVLAEDVATSVQPPQSIASGPSSLRSINRPHYLVNQSLRVVGGKEEQPSLLASRNQEISGELAAAIAHHRDVARVRSSLTCSVRHGICQLCYGWSLSEGRLVTLGEAVGIIAAQSIGEPGTQLTMRTFHTGGVFSGEVMSEVRAPHQGVVNYHAPLPGLLVRTSHGKVAFLTKAQGSLSIKRPQLAGMGNWRRGAEASLDGMEGSLREPYGKDLETARRTKPEERQQGGPLESREGTCDHPTIQASMAPIETSISIEAATVLFVRQGERVAQAQLLGEFSSMGVDRNETVEAKRTLFAELSGEIAFVNLLFGSPVREDGSTGQMSKSLGLIWVLSGQKSRIAPLVAPYGQGSHLVDRGSLVARILGSSPPSLGGWASPPSLCAAPLGARWPPLRWPGAAIEPLAIKGVGLPTTWVGKTTGKPTTWVANKPQRGTQQPAVCQATAIGAPRNRLSPPMGLSHRQDDSIVTMGHMQPRAVLHANSISLSSKGGYQIQLSTKWGGQAPLWHTNRDRRGVRAYPTVVPPQGGMASHDWIVVNLPDQRPQAEDSHGTAFLPPLPHLANSSGPVSTSSPASLPIPGGRPHSLGSSTIPPSWDHLKGEGSRAMMPPRGAGAVEITQSPLPLCTDGPHLSLLLGSSRIGPAGIVWIDSRCADGHLASGEVIWIQKKATRHCEAKASSTLDLYRFENNLLTCGEGQQATGTMALIAQSLQVKRQGATNPRARRGSSSPGREGLLPPSGQIRQAFSTLQSEAGRSGAWDHAQATWPWSEASVEQNSSGAIPNPFDTAASASGVNRSTIDALRRRWAKGGMRHPVVQTATQASCPAEWLYCPVQPAGLPYWHESLQVCSEAALGGQAHHLDDLILDPSPSYIEAVIGGQYRHMCLDTKTLAGMRVRILSEKGRTRHTAGEPVDASQSIGTISWLRHLVAQPRWWASPPLRDQSQGSGLLGEPSSWTRVVGTKRTGTLLFLRKTLLLPRCPVYLTCDSWEGRRGINRQEVLTGGRELDAERDGGVRSTTVPRWREYQLLLWRDLLNDDAFLWLRGFPLQALVIKNRGSRFGPSPSPLGYSKDGKREKANQSVAHETSTKVGRWPRPALGGLTHLLHRKSMVGVPTPQDGQGILPYLFAFAGCPGSITTPPSRFGNRERLQPNSLLTIPAGQSTPLTETWLGLGRVVQLSVSWSTSWTPRVVDGTQNLCKPHNPVPVNTGALGLKGGLLRPWLSEHGLVAVIRKGSRRPLPITRESALARSLQACQTADHRLALEGATTPRSQERHYWALSSANVAGAANLRDDELWDVEMGAALPMRCLRAISPMLGALHSSAERFVPSIKGFGTKLVSSLPSPRWRVAPLTSMDGFQTAVVSRPLHLVRFAAHLWTPVPGVGLPTSPVGKPTSRELVDVAILLKAGVDSSPLLLFAAGRVGGVEKESEWQVVRGSDGPLASSSQPLPIQGPLTAMRSPVTGEMVGTGAPVLRKGMPTRAFSNSSPSPYTLFPSEGVLAHPWRAPIERRLVLTESDCMGLATEGHATALGLGQFLCLGEEVAPGEATALPGQVIAIERRGLTLRRTQTLLFYSQGAMHVQNGEWVERGAPILTLTYQKLVTGDIVQGIPKIEQFFEAPTTRDGEPIPNSLQTRVRRGFERLRKREPAPQAVKGSVEDIQQTLVEGILKVYLSQGVRIADKHLEIVVRQMTSKGHVLDAGDTGLFRGEQVDLGRIERLNLATYGKRASYEPAVLGITKAALDSDSFISAASFQETTRVLSRDTVIGKTDFLRGLKERVVLGDLIQAGTGLDDNINYGLLFGVANLEQAKVGPIAQAH